MIDSEYVELRSYLEKKTHCLWKHETSIQRKRNEEEKNYYQGGFAISNCFGYNSPQGDHYGIAYTSKFFDTLTLYLRAFHKYPNNFGTGDAIDILNALYETMNAYYNPFSWSRERYQEYLQEENCLYAVPQINGHFIDDFLRIDLFRNINSSKSDASRKEFVGGLFHLFDHFSINGKNLATANDINDVNSLCEIIGLCVGGFTQKAAVGKNQFCSFLPYDEKHRLKIAFYKEIESGAFYINTAHLEKI